MSHYWALVPLLSLLLWVLTMPDKGGRVRPMSKRRRVGSRPTHLVLTTDRQALLADQERRRSNAAVPHTSRVPRSTQRQSLRQEYR